MLSIQSRRVSDLARTVSTLLLLAACSRTPTSGSPDASGPIRLATLRHAGTGGDAQVPTAIVGQVRRPVLAPWPRTLLARTVVAATPPRIEHVEAPIAPALRGVPLHLRALLTFLNSAVAGDARQIVQDVGRLLGKEVDRQLRPVPDWIPQPGATIDVAVPLPATSMSGDALLEIYAQPAETEWTSDPVTIPANAVLRFGLGIGDDDPDADLTGGEAKVSVVSGDASDVVFARALPYPGFARDRWNDEQIDLGAYAGRTVRLRFVTAGASLPLLWGDPTVAVQPASHPSRPNLILISLDTLRADHLGAYGYVRPTSPTIDAWLAARGTVFEDASTSFPNTAGSHMTMLTAVDPCVHGLDRTAFGGGLRVRDGVVTLGEVLRNAGYETAAFTEDAWVTAAVGYDRGFGTFVEDHGRNAVNDGNIEATFARGSAWIAAHRRDPFFVFLHTYQVHEPYEPPPGYAEQVAPVHGDSRAEREKALYDGEIRYTDDVLARFLAALDAEGLAARTLVLVVADHGQHFGEHGSWGHSFTLWQPVLRVPMILRGPGVPAGLRVPDPVGLIDIVPTVLELLGVPPPSEIQGTSLVPALHGKTLAPRLLYAELPERGLLSARRGDVKVIVNSRAKTRVAYDIARDPEEAHDVLASLPPGYVDEIERHRREHCRRGAAAPSTTPGPAIGGEVRRKLEALGYTE